MNYRIIGEDTNFLNAVTEFKVSDQASKDVLSAGKMSPMKPFLTHPKLDFKIPLMTRQSPWTSTWALA